MLEGAKTSSRTTTRYALRKVNTGTIAEISRLETKGAFLPPSSRITMRTLYYSTLDEMTKQRALSAKSEMVNR